MVKVCPQIVCINEAVFYSNLTLIKKLIKFQNKNTRYNNEKQITRYCPYLDSVPRLAL